MTMLSKQVVMMALVALSLSTDTPIMCGADESQVIQEPAKPLVTDEQIRKDWPEVMRMVNRTNEQFDFQDKAQRVIKITAGFIGVVLVTAVIISGVTSGSSAHE